MTDLSKISTALAGLSGEIAALRTNIETNLRTREELASQPMPIDDVREIMMAEVERLAAAAPVLLEKQVAIIAAHPNKSDWGNRLPFLPGDLEGLGQLLVGLLADQVKSGLTAALASRPEVTNAGPALAVRRKKLDDLDRRIEADEAALAALRQEVERHGISWPGRGLF